MIHAHLPIDDITHARQLGRSKFFSIACQSSMLPLRLIVIVALLALFSWPASLQAQTSKESRALKTIAQQIDRAGAAYKAKRYANSAAAIKRALRELDGVSAGASAEFIDAITADYARLKKAHELLSAQGQKLPELPSLAVGMTGNGGTVSFKEVVAPILIAKCGNCHVNQNRGDFSAASYTALVNSTTIAFGKPDDSRLIEVIENGEMPKGGLKVSADELKSLKSWIAQGAKFDGDAQGQNLRQLTGQDRQPGRPARMAVVKPTGKETVSFGLDIAPVLIEQCADCHIRRNPGGNFSMASFRTFLRGGDGGAPIAPGDVAGSALIMRLHGTSAEQMPPDRKLSDQVIAKFETWVKEGATFDGADEQLDFVTVAATAKAASMSHADLIKEREAQTVNTWKLAMGDIEGKTVSSPNFVVAASARETRLQDVADICEKMAAKISKTFKLKKDEPLVKGNISVFLFSKRYDFSEFGRMVEKREFPKEIGSHWNFDTINAYSAVLMTRNQTAEGMSVELTQQIATLHFASQAPDVPRWFASGMGLWTAKRIHPRADSMKELDKQAESAISSMKRLDDFVQNRMPDDQAAKVAYLFVNQLRSGSSSAFSKLMKNLKAGQTFEAAFAESYRQSPSEMLKKMSGARRR